MINNIINNNLALKTYKTSHKKENTYLHRILQKRISCTYL